MKTGLKINLTISGKDLKRIIQTALIALAAYHYGTSSGVTTSQPSVVTPKIEAKQQPKIKAPQRPKVKAPCK